MPFIKKAQSAFGNPFSTDARATVGVGPEMITGGTPLARNGPGLLQPARTVFTNFQAGHGYSFTSSGAGSDLNNADVIPGPRFGTQMIKVVTTGGGGASATNVRNFAVSSYSTLGKSQIVWAYCPDTTHLSKVEYTVGNTSIANRRTEPLTDVNSQGAGAQMLPSGAWTPLEVNGAHGFLTGSDPNAAVTNVQLTVTDDNTGNPVIVYFGAIHDILIPTQYPQGVVVFTFDDSYLGQYTLARPVMDAAGWQASAFPIIDSLDSAPTFFMSTAQLHGLQEGSGWDVGVHCSDLTTHNSIVAQPAPDIEIMAVRQWLQANSFQGNDLYAHPLGIFNGAISTTNKHFAVSRTIARGMNGYPFVRPQELKSVSGVGGVGGYGTASVIGTLDKLVLNGGIFIMTFHSITSGAATVVNECSIADLNIIIAAIQARPGIKVRSLSQLIQGI